MGCMIFAFDSFLKYSFAISILFLSPNMRTIASALLISGVSSAAKSKEILLQNTLEALGGKQSLPLHHCRTELQSRNRTRHLLLCAVCVSSDQYPVKRHTITAVFSKFIWMLISVWALEPRDRGRLFKVRLDVGSKKFLELTICLPLKFLVSSWSLRTRRYRELLRAPRRVAPEEDHSRWMHFMVDP